VLRVLGVLPYMSVHVNSDIIFGPDLGEKVKQVYVWTPR